MAEGNHVDHLFKVLLAGDEGVGKSNLLSRFARNEFNTDSRSTIGVEFATRIVMVEDKRVKAQVWDTAGRPRYRAITAAYYRGAHAALLVYDVTKLSSFSNIRTWVEELREYASPHVVTMLIGNKTDLDAVRVIPAEMAEAFAAENGMMYVETSALSAFNVQSAFESVLTEIYHIETSKHAEPSSTSSARSLRMTDRHFFDI